MDLIATWVAWGFFHCVFTLLFLPLQLVLLLPAWLCRWLRGDLGDLGLLLVLGGLGAGQLLIAWASKGAAVRLIGQGPGQGQGPVQAVLGTLDETRVLLSFLPLVGKRPRPSPPERGDGAV